MAAIPTLYDSDAGPINPGTEDVYQTALTISGASLSANSKYFIYAHHHIDSTQIGSSRIVAEGITVSELSIDVDSKLVCSHVHMVTTGTSPTDITLDIRRDTATVTDFRNMQLFVMLLSDDLVEGTDYAFDEDLSTTDITGSYVERASVTVTPNQTSDWYVFSSGNYDLTSAGNLAARLVKDGATSGDDVHPETEKSSLGSIDKNGYWNLSRYYSSVTAGSHTFGYQIVEETGNYQNYRTAIFALKLDVFKEFTAVFNNSGVTFAGTTFEELADLSITPSVTSDIMAFGFFTGNLGTSTTTNTVRIQKGGVSEPSDWDNREQFVYANSTTVRDGPPSSMMSRWAAQTTSLQDIDFDGKVGSVSNAPVARYISAVSFTTELSTNNRFISGTVTEKGQKVSRKVLVYRRGSQHELLGSTTSADDGSYIVNGLPAVECMVVAQDDDAGTDFNAVIITRVIPESS